MILIAESGSTKTEWVLVGLNGREEFRCQTSGMNPFNRTQESMIEELQQHRSINKIRSWVERIHFFGSGCSLPAQQHTIKQALMVVFPVAQSFVTHDLNAAGIACLGRGTGYVGILGTGSVLGCFEGGESQELIGGYGYSLGDEGGGTWFGKEVLRAHIYKQLPADLEEDFQNTYALTRADILDRLYKQEMTNAWLAAFCLFLGKHRSSPVMQSILRRGFEAFFDTHMQAVPRPNTIHFVGSIASNFEEELRVVADEQELLVGKVLTTPMTGLITYLGSGFRAS